MHVHHSCHTRTSSPPHRKTTADAGAGGGRFRGRARCRRRNGDRSHVFERGVDAPRLRRVARRCRRRSRGRFRGRAGARFGRAGPQRTAGVCVGVNNTGNVAVFLVFGSAFLEVCMRASVRVFVGLSVPS